LTDLPTRLLAAEITREQLFRRLHQEVPYALTVETEAWEEFQDGTAKINQVIFVAREGHKAIVVGEGGRQIKAVRGGATGTGEVVTASSTVPVRQDPRKMAGRPGTLSGDGAGLDV
jgi:GTPase Era involved in 16S rRNA processing